MAEPDNTLVGPTGGEIQRDGGVGRYEKLSDLSIFQVTRSLDQDMLLNCVHCATRLGKPKIVANSIVYSLLYGVLHWESELRKRCLSPGCLFGKVSLPVNHPKSFHYSDLDYDSIYHYLLGCCRLYHPDRHSQEILVEYSYRIGARQEFESIVLTVEVRSDTSSGGLCPF